MPGWALATTILLILTVWAFTFLVLARLNQVAAQVAAVQKAVDRVEILAADREHLLAIEGTVDRVIRDRAAVAAALVVTEMQKAAALEEAKAGVAGVKADLDASHARADMAEPGEAGGAADAAAKSPEAPRD